jgi:hypothetical protein
MAPLRNQMASRRASEVVARLVADPNGAPLALSAGCQPNIDRKSGGSHALAILQGGYLLVL